MANPARPATRVSPWRAGLGCLCPQCGSGDVFAGFLAFAPTCVRCGADFSHADTGDGAAVFVMFAVGFIVVPLALGLEAGLHPPTWLHLAVWIPVTIALALALLRPFKATFFALEWARKARAAGREGPLL